MASTSAARKAWNEAMRATAGTAALPPAFQRRPQKRRSDRNRKQERRTKARRVVTKAGGNGGGGDDDDDSNEYGMAVWMDALEGVDPAVVAAANDDDDEEFDELDDLDNGGKKNKSKSKSKRGKRGGGGGTKTGALPKRFLPRTLASILADEHGREDSTARLFLCAQALVPPRQQLPRRKFCPVTGLQGVYTEPKSGIPYANLKSLEQIRERSPPWMTLGGSAAFLEATKSIRDDEY